MIVGQQPILNMFNVHLPIQLAEGNQPTIAVGRWQIGQVETCLNSPGSVIQIRGG